MLLLYMPDALRQVKMICPVRAKAKFESVGFLIFGMYIIKNDLSLFLSAFYMKEIEILPELKLRL